MNIPYPLQIVDNCRTCAIPQQPGFCRLSPEALQEFSKLRHPSIFPAGAVLLAEAQPPRGIYVVCSGRVKLSTMSREGRVLILRVAGPGEVLGLSAVMTGSACELTAETVEPCHVSFVERIRLREFLVRYPEAGVRCAEAVSREFQAAFQDVHDLVLARTSTEKLARLLLSWSEAPEAGEAEARLDSGLTHEEMAQMIGSSRETVTRLLGELRRKSLIRRDGPALIIQDRRALEALAS